MCNKLMLGLIKTSLLSSCIMLKCEGINLFKKEEYELKRLPVSFVFCSYVIQVLDLFIPPFFS